MLTKRIGNIGEAYAVAAFAEMGIPVYQQFGDTEPADLLIIVDGKILKVQVKTSTTYDGRTTNFSLVSSTVHRKNGVKHKYTVEEVDLFVCYDTQTRKIFVKKNTGNLVHFSVRYDPAANNQVAKVNYYKDVLLCVETLHEIASSIEVKEKVQTTI